MPTTPQGPTDPSDRVGDAIAEYDRLRGSGERFDPWAFLADHPDVAHDLLLYIRRVHQLEGIVAPRPSAAPPEQ